jgi:hypothetical protein
VANRLLEYPRAIFLVAAPMPKDKEVGQSDGIAEHTPRCEFQKGAVQLCMERKKRRTDSTSYGATKNNE